MHLSIGLLMEDEVKADVSAPNPLVALRSDVIFV